MRLKRITIMLAVGTLLVSALPVSVSAQSLADLSKQESAAKDKISSVNDKIQGALDAVNKNYQEVATLKSSVADKEAEIQTAVAKMTEQKAELNQRKSQAEKRLQSLQSKNQQTNVVEVLMSSKSATDFFSRAYGIAFLQSASNENMESLDKAYEAVKETQAKLVVAKGELVKQQDALTTENESLQENLKDLKQTLKDNQGELAKITKSKAAEQERIKEAAEKAAAEKAVAEQAKADAAAAAVVQTKKAEAAKTETTTNTTTNNTTTNNNSTSNVSGNGKTLTMNSTAYSYAEAGASYYGATGIDLRKNPMCVAVDPSVIPLGTLVEVSGYGVAIAGDTGGAIKGNIVDVHFPTVAQCSSWGRRTVSVKLLS